MLARILLALSRPDTWAAILSGAGVLGVPVGMLVAWWRGRGANIDARRASYAQGHYDGVRDERARWAETVLCAREWSYPEPPDFYSDSKEMTPPHTLAEWVEHAQRRHGPFKYATEDADVD